MTGPTNIGVWFGETTALPAIESPQTEIRLDGRVEPRLALERLEMEAGAAPRAWFAAGLGRGLSASDDVRLEHLAPQILPGSLVTVTLLRGGVLPGVSCENLLLFEGRISRIEMNLDAEGESLRFEAEDLAAEVLRRRVGGRRLWAASGTADRTEGLSLVFNPDGRPNAAANLYDTGDGDPYHVFGESPAGDIPWTLDEAVAYLLAEHGASAAIDTPKPTEVRAQIGALAIRDVSLEGRTLIEAIKTLLDAVGGRVTVAVEPQAESVSRRLEFVLPGRGLCGWLAHQPEGNPFDPLATQLSGLSAAMHFDQAPRHYVARGDRKIYESTFELIAGWDDALASYEPDRFTPSRNPDFLEVRDVFRKWVLNEAGDYADDPYNRGPGPDFSALFEGAPYVRRRRRFLDSISVDALGRSHGVYVEVSYDGGGSWERPDLTAQVLADECGLYFTDDSLPPRYLVAAMYGSVRVRVTAAIESDACLEAERVAEGSSDMPGQTRYLSVASGFRFRRIAPTSRFYGGVSAGEVDDAVRLQELVDSAYEADRRCPAPARIEIPWLALGHRLGERLLGLRGRRLNLARLGTPYETDPVVCRIRHDFVPSPRTELELE